MGEENSTAPVHAQKAVALAQKLRVSLVILKHAPNGQVGVHGNLAQRPVELDPAKDSGNAPFTIARGAMLKLKLVMQVHVPHGQTGDLGVYVP